MNSASLNSALSKTPRRNIAVLGCTGSIGRSTLEVIASLGKPYQAIALSAHRSVDQLVAATLSHHVNWAAITDPDAYLKFKSDNVTQANCRWLVGSEALIEIAQSAEIDIVVAAIVGSAGLESCLAAAEAGKRLALANKEALVVAGPLLTAACEKSGAELLPVDSEHSAIFQSALAGKDVAEIDRLILTASGGSLRDWPAERLEQATVADALKHPTWKMGDKITVDSATMMNKALEIVEARWLFGIPADRISAVIHPQSIVHSMVEFVDGSVIAQLSPPDMRLPIQYALTYPERKCGPARKLDWSEAMHLDWTPADLDRYPALKLGFEVATAGGTSGAVLNAANEAAVALFLAGKLRFTDVTVAVADVLHHHTLDNSPTLSQLLELDRWARREVMRWHTLAKGSLA